MSASNPSGVGEQAEVARPGLGARVLQHLRRLTTPAAEATFDDSRLGLEARILATRTQIDALHRSLAMQKQALDVTQRSRPGPAPAPMAAASSGHGYTQPLDLPLDEASESAYAETQPMPFIDLRPREALGVGALPENPGRK